MKTDDLLVRYFSAVAPSRDFETNLMQIPDAACFENQSLAQVGRDTIDLTRRVKRQALERYGALLFVMMFFVVAIDVIPSAFLRARTPLTSIAESITTIAGQSSLIWLAVPLFTTIVTLFGAKRLPRLLP